MLRTPVRISLGAFVLLVLVGNLNLLGALEPSEVPLEPVPPSVMVAGTRVLFSRDQNSGRIDVSFMDLEQFTSQHAEVLKKQRRLGDVSFSFFKKPLTGDDVQLLADVPLTGLKLWRVPVMDQGWEALKGHPTLELLYLDRVTVSDTGFNVLRSLPKLNQLGFSFNQISDASLARIAEIKQLKSLGFTKCSHITDDGIMLLAGIDSLERLFLQDNERLTHRIVQPLCQLQNLNRLDLIGIKLDPDDIAAIARLKKLETLSLSKSGIDDEAAKQLAQFNTLKSLTLQDTAITDKGVALIARLTGLKSVGLARTAVTNEGVAHLAGIHGLESLDLSFTKITDEGLKELATLSNLKHLQLNYTAVTDQGLRQLEKLKGLEELGLNRTSVSEAEIVRFREMHPQITVQPLPRPVRGK